MKTNDPRYSFVAQWTPLAAKPVIIVRYCGGWIGQAGNRDEAHEIAAEHRDAMFNTFEDAR